MSFTLTSAPLLIVIAALIAGVTLALLLRFAAVLPHGLPGPRSLHNQPTPRVGGLAIWAGAIPAAALQPPTLPGPSPVWALAFTAVLLVSLLDDWRGVNPVYRLFVQLAAAAAVAVALSPEPEDVAGWVAAAVTALSIVWAANLYNFMDGTDGLAAAMGLCGFAAYGIAALLAGTSSAFFFALAAAIAVFFGGNFPPARIFMGDVGAVPLGFLAAAFGLAGWHRGWWPGWFPVLVFLPFVADATVTLCRRLLRRERVWKAHKEHYYQRLHQLGAGHSGTLVFYGVLMVGTGTSALMTLAIDPGSGWAVTTAWMITLGALFGGIDYHWRQRTATPR